MNDNSAVALTVITPMFNEADGVASTVQRIEDALQGFEGGWEHVIVDDGSTDESRARAEALVTSHPRLRVVGYPENRGRGFALRTGYQEARGDLVVTTDFDLSYSPDHILTLARYLQKNPGCDLVLGSAYMPGGATEGVPLARLLISRWGNRVLALAIGNGLHTLTCVLRAYRRTTLDRLDLESSGKEIHLETLARCLALGLTVHEVPATLRPRKKGRSKFRFGGTAITHLLFMFSERPMLVFGGLGLLLTLAGTAIGFYLAYLWSQAALTAGRPLITILALLFLSGLQFVSFGLLGILIGSLRKEIYRLQSQVTSLARGSRERS